MREFPPERISGCTEQSHQQSIHYLSSYFCICSHLWGSPLECCRCQIYIKIFIRQRTFNCRLLCTVFLVASSSAFYFLICLMFDCGTDVFDLPRMSWPLESAILRINCQGQETMLWRRISNFRSWLACSPRERAKRYCSAYTGSRHGAFKTDEGC